ncbi:Hint domain-containing protein [Roseovarius sp. MMSF_3281]|uniref:Hint domain-containing protein n=1 Tax=Roseovarius sp. MMSF_3281 TaxID=3046694 RepID=UPI00273DE39D|nr:Hint domain-containing protein [Roseovarius sp. MMSF_3281]
MVCTIKIDFAPQASNTQLGLPQITHGWHAALNVAKSTGGPLPDVAANAPDTPTRTDAATPNPRIGLTKGTMIDTLDGPKPVQDLKPRDMLRTGHGSYRPLRHLFPITPETPRPAIRIDAGALGEGLPVKNLRLPTDQQILVTSEIAQKMFGDGGVLVPVRLLTALGRVKPARLDADRLYLLLLDQQDTVLANGVPVETLAPCAANLGLLPPHLRTALTRLFPGFADSHPEVAKRLKVPRLKRQKRLVRRHANAGRALLDDPEEMPKAQTA